MRVKLVFICFLIFSCSENQLKNDLKIYENEELKALNDVIITLWERKTGYGPKILPPLPLSERKNKKDSIRYFEEMKFVDLKFKELESGIVDTSFFGPTSFIVFDTLVGLSENIDTNIFNSPLLKHVINTSQGFDVESIIGRNGYLFVNKLDLPFKDRPKHSGLIFSRIIFNKNYNMGYFTWDAYECGYIIYIEKINGKWTIKKKEQIWVE